MRWVCLRALMHSNSKHLDCVRSRVVWCGGPLHHPYQKVNSALLAFFLPDRADSGVLLRGCDHHPNGPFRVATFPSLLAIPAL